MVWTVHCSASYIVSLPTNRSRSGQQSKSPGQIRIIAGQWRGRRLPVADAPGLRPTGDRVRETLFNWLQRDIASSHCLDLFAGTGVLGLEALSRHAASVTFVEPNPQANGMLKSALATLGVDTSAAEVAGTQVLQTSAERFLVVNRRAFDIVFIDPPFSESMQIETLQALLPNHLTESALLYVEAPTEQEWTDPQLLGYTTLKEKRFGEVYARLLSISSL
jgi:16S rRNA (guanine966-N2)-methyltransferase